MKQYDLAEGMRMYIARLREQGRYSSAKSYQDALKIMEEGGYDLPREDEQAEPVEQVAGFARHIPFLRKYPLEKQIMILFVIIAVFLALVIYFGSLISSN